MQQGNADVIGTERCKRGPAPADAAQDQRRRKLHGEGAQELLAELTPPVQLQGDTPSCSLFPPLTSSPSLLSLSFLHSTSPGTNTTSKKNWPLLAGV